MGQDHNHDPNCLFCKIAHGDIPAEKLYDDGEIFVIRDIHPLTPIHLLIIPHVHTATLLDLQDMNLVGRIFEVARKMAKEQGVDQQGFRILHNVNEWGGQKIFHIHFHLLAGTKLD